ncbi:MAG: helix-turn-helix domain-containing protein, partial [Pseudolysinimonas sp.]
MGENAAAGPTVTGRALAVLDSFDRAHRRQSLAAISRRTGLPLTTVHRLVHELEHHGAGDDLAAQRVRRVVQHAHALLERLGEAILVLTQHALDVHALLA